MRFFGILFRVFALLATLSLAQAQAAAPRAALWGSTTPIVYALADDGSLAGLWDSGHGEETLTPEQ